MKHKQSLSSGDLIFSMLQYRERLSAGLSEGELQADYAGDVPVDTGMVISLGGNFSSVFTEDEVAYLEEVTLEYLTRQLDGQDVNILGVSVTAQEVQNATGTRRLQRDESSQQSSSISVSTTITGEYRPPPYVDFPAAVEDAIDANNGQAYKDDLTNGVRERPGELDAFLKVTSVSAESTAPREPIPPPIEKSGSNIPMIVGIVCGVMLLLAAFVWFLCRRRKRDGTEFGEDGVFFDDGNMMEADCAVAVDPYPLEPYADKDRGGFIAGEGEMSYAQDETQQRRLSEVNSVGGQQGRRSSRAEYYLSPQLTRGVHRGGASDILMTPHSTISDQRGNRSIRTMNEHNLQNSGNMSFAHNGGNASFNHAPPLVANMDHHRSLDAGMDYMNNRMSPRVSPPSARSRAEYHRSFANGMDQGSFRMSPRGLRPTSRSPRNNRPVRDPTEALNASHGSGFDGSYASQRQSRMNSPMSGGGSGFHGSGYHKSDSDFHNNGSEYHNSSSGYHNSGSNFHGSGSGYHDSGSNFHFSGSHNSGSRFPHDDSEFHNSGNISRGNWS